MVLFMADNLFVSQKKGSKVHWLSLDGEKMECSHNEDDVQIYLDFIKSQYNDVDPTIWSVYETLAKSQMVGAPVLIGDVVLKNDWLSSGYPGTADMNCIKMSMIVSCIREIRNRAFNQGTFSE